MFCRWFVGALKRLRSIAEQYSADFDSEGFKTFFAMLRRELADDYFAIIKDHLRRLKFRGGVLISAELGKGNKAKNYVLRKPNPQEGNWISRIIEQGPPRMHVSSRSSRREWSESSFGIERSWD